MIFPTPKFIIDFADDVLSQRALDVGSRGEGAASEQQLRVRIHGDEGEDLQGAVDEGGAQQVVDAQWNGRVLRPPGSSRCPGRGFGSRSR